MKQQNKPNSNETYQSPFSWRYGSSEMRSIFSEAHKYRLWRRIWVALARAQSKAGLVSQEELSDLQASESKIDIDRILELEKETKHDVFAAITEFAEKAAVGGGKIHLGATSMDINDNADAMRIKEALTIVEQRLKKILNLLTAKVEQYADTPCMGYTHLQPAEPTTVGYRFAYYAQELIICYDFLQYVRSQVKGKGLKGAVGTAASYHSLLCGTHVTEAELETQVMESLGIESMLVTSQIATKQIDGLVLQVLAMVSAAIGKYAADLRILQSPMFGEWAEPFGNKQVGSSAMPFKRNPVSSEKIDSLARYVVQLPAIALENCMHSYLERTLDDSANRRVVVADAFLAVDEILATAERLLNGMQIHEERISRNVERYGPFAVSESVLMKAVKNGANRQQMHEVLKEISMEVWQEVEQQKNNTMVERMKSDSRIQKYLSPSEIDATTDIRDHIGDAPARARQLALEVRTKLGL
ncbi:MAG: adenylosuccinate lyase [Patescibacteria group bacterium]